MAQIKATIIAIEHDEESDNLTLENLWLPQGRFCLDVSGGDDFKVGDTVLITVEETK